MSTMNRYGVMAQRHWERWLPGRVGQMDDASSFFSMLGEEVAAEIETVSVGLAGDDPPGEGYLAKLGRLQMARLQAEEQVLAERVLLPPEPAAGEDETPQTAAESPAAEWVPLVEDPAHPWWQQAAAQEEDRTG
jgi:hypothetical protein